MQCMTYKDICFQFENCTFYSDVAVGPISDNVILGLDFLTSRQATIDLQACLVTLDGCTIPAKMVKGKEGSSHQVATVFISGRQMVPPLSVKRITASLSNNCIATFVTSPSSTSSLSIPSCLVQGGSDPIIMEVTNDSDHPVYLADGDILTGAVEADIMNETLPQVRQNCQDGEDLPDEAEIESRNAGSPLLSSKLLSGENKATGASRLLPEGIRDLHQRSSQHLNNKERDLLAEILREYAHTFATSKEDLGRFDLIKHRILTTDEVPVQERMRRTPIKFVGEEETTIKSMLKAGVIRPSMSSWASAPVLVRKKDGEVRYTVDYRKVNAKTVKDVYPLPLITECMDALEGTLWFHTLDLASGYWQIDIDPRDAHKTAFLTRHGLFEHVRLAQGLCNAPATFQRVMHLVLRGLTWDRALVYLDDVIVLGRDFPSALQNLEMVLQRFSAHNLKLKPKKCHLFSEEVTFLGRNITREGISVSDPHIKSLQEWPVPRDIDEIQKFLGFINYHREFIPNLSRIASPLFALTRKDSTYRWNRDCQEAFVELKKIMTSPPVLRFPNSTNPFILDTDASDFSLGACLYQVQDGLECPISYSSVLLSPVQRRYCTTRKELLAIVLFTRQYRHYLLGAKFIVRTDHHSLAWLFRFKDYSGQLGRWLEELSQYSMEIQHRSGAKHTNADAMSRIPTRAPECKCYFAGCDVNLLPCGGCAYCKRVHGQWSRFEEDVDYVVPLCVRAIDIGPGDELSLDTEMIGHSQVDIRKQQDNDPVTAIILKWMQKTPDQKEHQLQGSKVKALWRQKDQLELHNDVLHYRWHHPDSSTTLKLIVPTSMQNELLNLAHDSKGGGHWGRNKTWRRLQQSFFWPGMSRDVDLYIRTCAACSKNKKGLLPRSTLLNYQAGEPNERVHLDFLGPFETSLQGNRYILSIVDQFTRWIEIYPLPEQTASITAKTFMDGWISRFGVPKIVHTDQGRNFTSKLFQDLCSYLECTKTRTTPYRPSSNGQVERYNRMILSYIRCFLCGNDKEWDMHLPTLCMSLRSTVNRSTGYTANMLQLGREIRMPWDIVFGTGLGRPCEGVDDYIVKKLKSVEQVFEKTRLNISAAQEIQKRGYDQRNAIRHVRFDVGDLIYTINANTPPGHSHKLQSVLKGPYIVAKVISPLLFTVRDNRKSYVLHHDRMRLCEDREVPLWVHRVRNSILYPEHTTNMGTDTNPEHDDPLWDLQGIFGPNTNGDNGDLHDSAVEYASSANTEQLAPEENDGGTTNTAHEAENNYDTTNIAQVPLPAHTSTTRTGRTVTAPQYLRDYVCD